MNQNAVSHITGVVVMIAISVLAFSVLYFFVLDDLERLAPNNCNVNLHGYYGRDGIDIGHYGGETINYEVIVNDVKVLQGSNFSIGEELKIPCNTTQENEVIVTAENQIVFYARFPPIIPLGGSNETNSTEDLKPEVALEIYNLKIIDDIDVIVAIQNFDNKTIINANEGDTGYVRFSITNITVTNINNVTFQLNAKAKYGVGKCSIAIKTHNQWYPTEINFNLEFENHSILYATNPFTLLNWTTQEVNDLEVQVAIMRSSNVAFVNEVRVIIL